MELNKINLYYLLEKDNLTPKLKELKLKFDKAVSDWNDAHNALDSANELEDIDNAINRLHKINNRITKIKKEILEEKAAHK
ncbi:MAG: hypothetical protein ACQEP3_00045 [Patescibacteria group bacterium]